MAETFAVELWDATAESWSGVETPSTPLLGPEPEPETTF